ncbi:hypothetical protein [Klebsiella pneumoniae]|uniref:hypothetical protein n=1 Tax=Klebsiella pneumoniae TaxID=573 RepID=UPI00217DB2DA|nr:hypothetical protein [Klebsiella pneumoniae]MCS6675600.1 hypothetical protein [Klebsiella pneumoniae subsp. pneumoniae]HCF8363555.1 hypothetical protein [Klebsiella pneumoniae]
MTEQTILDMCCGSRMFWFDKQDPRAVFADIRSEQHTLCDGRSLIISPDIIADFRALPFADEKPAIWQRTGKADKTHWVIFVKGADK